MNASILPAMAPGRDTAERSRHVRSLPLIAPVAWGVFLFGAVYPWTYRPLMAAVAVVGAYGWVTATREERQPAYGLALGALCITALALLQLVPLPLAIIQKIYPAEDSFLSRYEVAYAIARRAGAPVTHALSISPSKTVLGLMFVVALGIFVAGCTALIPRITLPRLLDRLVAIGFVLAIFGIVQKATFNDRIYWFWKPVNVANNAFGPFVNRNHFAGWMLMTASLTAGYLRGLLSPAARKPVRSWRDRAAWFSSLDGSRAVWVAAALFVMVLSIVWTMSRSGIAAMAIAGTLFGIHSTTRRHGRAPMLGVWFVLCALAIAIVWRGTSEISMWYSRTNTLQWRVEQWRDTLPIIRDYTWLGTGLDTYGPSLLLYPTSHPESITHEAHNDYVQIVSEGGIALAVIALGMIAVLARQTRKAFAETQSRNTYWIRIGAVTGLVAIAIQETVDFSLQMPGNAVLFCVLVAIAIHRSHSER